MKKICVLAVAGILASSGLVFAQNIELPDVTTEINGENIKAGLDALPDFSNVIAEQKGSGNVVPQLPDSDIPADEQVQNQFGGEKDKSIFAEGVIGGGYPTLFIGDFSVFRANGVSPFKLAFSHNSAVGYADHSLTDGFNDHSTKMSVEKSYKNDNLEWGISGSYQSVSNGLQKHVDGISAVNQTLYNGNGDFIYHFNNGVSLGLNADMNFYNRYADVTDGYFPTLPYLALKPEFFVMWQGNGFTVDLTCNYTFGADTSSEVFEDKIHRGDFRLGFEWQNDVVRLFADAGAVVGNGIYDNLVVVPFDVGVDASIPVSFSNRHFTLTACGGIDSKLPQLYELENKYKFTTSSFIAGEQSDWFGRFECVLPVQDAFTGSFMVEYRKSAFDTGVANPVYSKVSRYGTYDYSFDNLQQFNSSLMLSYQYKIMTISGGWKSYWLDVPALECQNLVTVDLNLLGNESKWGADLNAAFGLGDESITPVINMEAFAGITSAVRAVLSFNDVIQLFKAEPRVYAGQYIGRNGNVCLLLKFFF